MMRSDLWAKSSGNPPVTVLRHGQDVLDAGAAILATIRPCLAAALGLTGELICKGLLPLVEVAGILHDFAKINSAFQLMLRAKHGHAEPQPIRHEILGAMLLADSDYLGSWLEQLLPSVECWRLIWAIAGHHLKMGDPAQGAVLFSQAGASKWLSLPMSDDQARSMLESAASILGKAIPLPQLVDLRFDVTDDDSDSLESRVHSFAEGSVKEWNRLRRADSEMPLRTAVLKALLISADVAGSALTAIQVPVGDWITSALSNRLGNETLSAVVKKGTKGKTPLDFQTVVGAAPRPATIVIAGCGNGKTTAAYMWAQKWAVDRKLIFTYPTTGTASAGFEDYVFRQPELAVALIHGRSSVDLQAMQRTGEEDAVEETIRLESLQAWDRQVIVCTVDTILGLMQNNRRPLFSFPAIVSGAIVFDEIHSYDSHLFGALLRFLETFPGVPVLLMSASIPPTRLDHLKKTLAGRVGPIINGDPILEGHKRYEMHHRDSADACKDQVRETLAHKQMNKVLWVCNTVGDAVEMASKFRQWLGFEPIIYHSRFRYRNRVQRQQDLIARFRRADFALAVTTQVCEMSLDISANLLVTAECPLPSLVQRMGRLNRYADRDDPWPCLVYPFEGLPYNEQPTKIQRDGDFRIEMKAMRDAVASLRGKPVSQQDLAVRLDLMITEEKPRTYSAWLDDGWLTEPAPVRDSDNSVTLIRVEDLEDIKQELGSNEKYWTSRNLVPWTIPMTYRRDFAFERRIGGYPLAPSGSVEYSETEGAKWPSKNKA